MKTTQLAVLLAFGLQPLTSSLVFAAASFNSGSTGAYGSMNITNDATLQFPPDGIFHCTTITVAQGATLKFNRNPLNTPVYLLATGDVVVNGTIDVSAQERLDGLGGPGGFDGGHGGSVYEGQTQGGDGFGPGGGTSVNPSGTFAGVYGNLLLVPLIGGSGSRGVDGAPGLNGLGGGGAIMIASTTRITISGIVSSYGYSNLGYYIYSSGGAIRLVAPLVGGSGLVEAKAVWAIGATCYGRIRIDCQDNQAYRTLNLTGAASRGNRMMVFPAVIQALDIIEVAGNVIPAGTNAPVVFELPVGVSTNQTVRVQARNFTGDIPIRVVVTPENGPSGSFDANILQSSGNPPFANVPVMIPAGSACQIHAWTR